MLYIYPILLALLSIALSLQGSRWIGALYEKNGDILTFPGAVKERGRWKKYLLGPLFFIAGVRYYVLTQDPLTLALLLFATALLLLMAATDLEQYCLFDAMMVPFAIGGLAAATLSGVPLDHLEAAVAGGVIFFAIAVLTRGAMGGGDVKLIASLGLWLGVDGLISVAVAGTILGGLAALVLLLLKKKTKKSAFAYGPYFCAATLALFLLRGL